MSPKSRLAIFVFSFFFFLTGVLAAYARCMEKWGTFGTHSEVIDIEQGTYHTGSAYLHCPEALSVHRLAQLQNLPQRNVTPKLSLEVTRPSDSSVSSDSRSIRTSPGQLFPLFLHPSIPIYQSKVVYKI